MQIDRLNVRRVLVVDDNPNVRETYAYAIEDMQLQPVYEDGPLRSVPETIASLRTKADALVCDYHLRKKNYSRFNGDDLVVETYRSGFPSILCTSYNDFDLTLMRQKRRFIPALVKAEELGPDMIAKAFLRCIAEKQGRFDPSRKPWRTLVRVEEVFPKEEYCYVVIPTWNADLKIRVLFCDLPTRCRNSVTSGMRMHAQVNIGAEKAEEIYFDAWEVA
jgi:CheY-like chemotaxis protein